MEPFFEILIYLVLIFGGMTIFGKFIVLPLFQSRQRSQAKAIQEQKKGKSLEDSLEDLIVKAPDLLAEVNKVIESQRASGVQDAEMSNLISKQSMLKTIVDNQEIVQIVGKPAIKFLVNITRRFGIT